MEESGCPGFLGFLHRQDQASDIDVLIIGEPETAQIEESLRALERRLRREINYTLFTKGELESRLKKKDHFVADIWKTRQLIYSVHEKAQAARARF